MTTTLRQSVLKANAFYIFAFGCAGVIFDIRGVLFGLGPQGRLLADAPHAGITFIEARDLKQVGAQPMDLGSYEVVFDGTTPPDGAPVGTLRDLGGPFRVEGTVKLTPPNAYLVQGYITGRTAAAERVVREITLGAMPEASGRSPFSFEGTY